MSTDWFRNTTWDEAIERAFNEKLGRARRTLVSYVIYPAK